LSSVMICWNIIATTLNIFISCILLCYNIQLLYWNCHNTTNIKISA
jgi:hypothetical protein